jgi:hypothetical protein
VKQILTELQETWKFPNDNLNTIFHQLMEQADTKHRGNVIDFTNTMNYSDLIRIHKSKITFFPSIHRHLLRKTQLHKTN